MKFCSIKQIIYVAIVALSLQACGQATFSLDTTSTPPADESPSENTGTSDEATTQANPDGVAVKLYSPCPGPDCIEVEAYVPPKEDWCKSGFRLCAKKK